MNIDDGKMNSVVFLDIKKAFDTVDHQIMLDKLKCYGIHEDELAFFMSYLNDRQQCCNVNNVFSSTRKITCGVPQGSILDPLLFIIYMNDLPVSVTGVDIKMSADDTSLYRAFKTINDLQEKLIPAFSRVCEWLKRNKLSLNAVKTEFIIMGTVQKLNQLDSEPDVTPYKLYVSGFEIRRVKVVKYLVLMVDEFLTWEHHIEYVIKNINRGIGILKRVRHFLHRESLIILYQTLIEPYYRYCSIVWGQCCETLKDKLQVLQNRAARTIARLKYEDAG